MNSLIHLDFTQPRARPRYPWLGALLLALGALALIGIGLWCRNLEQHRAGLALQLANQTAKRQVRPESEARVSRDSAATARTAEELATPWTQLLAELEQASTDAAGDVAILAVEPDHSKHKVHVKGEAHDLGLAIAYVVRLQQAHSLRYPMLDSHELKSDDVQHPVQFEITADWRDGS